MFSFVEVPSFGWNWESDAKVIHTAMHQPGVIQLHLRHIVNLSRPTPNTLREPKQTSPVAILRVTHVGPVYAAFDDVLSWPAQLKTLQIFSFHTWAGGEKSYDDPSASAFTTSGFMAAIAPLKTSLGHLCYSVEYQGEGFQRDVPTSFSHFVNLKTLHVPLDLIWEDPNGEYNQPIITPPLHLKDILPHSLQELVINGEESLCGHEDAVALAGYLRQFASSKEADSTLLPDLRTLHIDGRDPDAYWTPENLDMMALMTSLH